MNMSTRKCSFLVGVTHQVALRCPDYLELSVEELLALIEDDRLNVRGEEVVFEAAVHWVSPLRRNAFVA